MKKNNEIPAPDNIQEAETDRQLRNKVKSVMTGIRLISQSYAGTPSGRGGTWANLLGDLIARNIIEKNPELLSKTASNEPMEAYTLFLKVNFMLPEEWIEWEPVTISEVTGFNGLDLEKILISRLIFKELDIHDNWHLFEKMVLAFNDRETILDTIQEIHSPEIAWAINEMFFIDPVCPLGEEIWKYIAIILYHEGFLHAPHVLNAAEPYLRKLLKNKSIDLNNEINIDIKENQDKLHKRIIDYILLRSAKLYDEIIRLG